jgi:hypothetical protein
MDEFTSTVELTPDDDRKAKRREQIRQWRAQNPEKVREYARQGRIKHADRDHAYARKYRAENREKIAARHREWSKKNSRKRWDTLKAVEHAEARDQFELERAAETRRHLQMKATQLRRSIIRDGVIADHAAWDWDMSGMVDHAPVDDHVELEPAIIDFQHWFAV